MDVLDAQLKGGTTQRDIEQAGITADLKQFEQERDYPMQQVKFMHSLLDGLPLETQTYEYTSPSGLQNVANAGADILTVLRQLKLIPEN